jgi:hypothetical protein
VIPSSAPALELGGVGGGSTVVNVNMGGVAISNGMDQVAFEQRVLQIVSSATRRR